MDKTHRVLIFDHSFDELSFSQSLCEEDGGVGGGRRAQVLPREGKRLTGYTMYSVGLKKEV